ncbi:sensor histidine kinase [Coralloluteibacterium thermophilus]|uniref:histidine kinase n=1 Tax=Coralloluteibacterium thermophilum TaxID=2707049 RepID=A0ABV9NJ70_9GAMM
MRPCSLRTRLVGAALLAALLAISAGFALTQVARIASTPPSDIDPAGDLADWDIDWPDTTGRLLQKELREELEHLDEGLVVAPDGSAHVMLERPSAHAYDAMPKDTAFLVLDADGRELVSSDEGPALQALRDMPAGARALLLDNRGTPLPLYVIEGTIERDGRLYTARVARSERLMFSLINYARKLYLRAGVVTVALTLTFFVVIVFLMVNRLLRPLREASEAAARIGPHTLSIRLRGQGLPSELAPLIGALNSALTRLEEGFRVQQEFLATAAHELKTPLALLQAEIELGATADPEVLLRDTALMARQVNQLLHLAEVSEGHNYRFARVSLRVEAAGAIDYLSRMADQRGVALRLDLERDEPGRWIEADAGALFVLFKNLLENAVHHSPAGGEVRLRVGAEGFSVEDEGDGVPAGAAPHLFKRFWRGAGAHEGGAGLGLAICREICLAHGWTITLDAAHGDRGARFVVAMPRGNTA